MGVDDDLAKNRALRILSVNMGLSTLALKNKLKQHNIPDRIIDEVVTNDEDKQVENALHVIKKRMPLVKGDSDFERSQKMLKYLLSKGFAYQCCQLAIGKYTSENMDKVLQHDKEKPT